MKYSLSVFLIILFFFPIFIFAQGTKNTLNPDFVNSLSSADYQESMDLGTGGIAFPVQLGYEAFISPKNTNFPSYFDLRDMAVLPPVKTQSSGGCWAYSSMSTVEARLLFLGEAFYDFSDNNLKYCHGFFPGRSTKGNAWMTTAYFARQSGPLLEEQDPFPGGTTQPGVDCPVDEAPAFFIRDSRYPPNDMSTIKQLIMDVGSIWSLIYYNSAYFNGTENTYFYGGPHLVNHVLNVVGWDDNKVTDGGIGAWICQNTYGTSWGENGFFYVSYNDSQFLLYNAYYPNHQSYNEDSRVLQYDDLGNYSSYGYGSEIGFALVKYPIYEGLFINEIGTYAMAYGTEISMEVFSDFDENTGVLSGLLSEVSPQTTEHPGYYTFPLDNAFAVHAGGHIFIKIKYICPGYDWPIPVELYIEDYADPYIESEVSWISSNGMVGNWLSVGADTDYPIDLCVKAYGVVNPMTIPLADGIIVSLFLMLMIFYIYKRY